LTEIYDPGDLRRTLRRWYIDHFLEQQIEGMPAGQTILDLGGTSVEKRGRFDLAPFLHQVVTANIMSTRKPAVQADAHHLPFSAEIFDAVICTELLEHVYKPDQVLRETFRILKKGGVLLITAPFLTPIHADPKDFGRYTDTFWLRTLHDCGFHGVNIINQGNYWSVLLDMLRDHVINHPPGDEFWKRIFRLILKKGIVFGRRRILAGHGDKTIGLVSPGRFTTGYGIIAQRPDSQSAEKS
jgi:SAM-dependent methyltransferase